MPVNAKHFSRYKIYNNFMVNRRIWGLHSQRNYFTGMYSSVPFKCTHVCAFNNITTRLIILFEPCISNQLGQSQKYRILLFYHWFGGIILRCNSTPLINHHLLVNKSQAIGQHRVFREMEKQWDLGWLTCCLDYHLPPLLLPPPPAWLG